MSRHPLQHTVRGPSLAKRFAFIVTAGLVATIATVMVSRMSVPLLAMNSVPGTAPQPRAIAIDVLRHVARSRCAGLTALLDLLDRQGQTAATREYGRVVHELVECPLPVLIAAVGVEQGPVTAHSFVAVRTPLDAAARNAVYRRYGIDGTKSRMVSDLNAAYRRANGGGAREGARQAPRHSAEEVSDEI